MIHNIYGILTLTSEGIVPFFICKQVETNLARYIYRSLVNSEVHRGI